MNARQALKESMATPAMVVRMYLDDLSDEDLLVRPVDGTNHIAWQMGHLIRSENSMVEAVCPGAMPQLPDGFADKYTNDTAALDDPNAFHSKAELLKLFDEQYEGTLAALDRLSDEDLGKPAPESLQRICPNVGTVFSMQSWHWMMHAGQWAVIRRKLGRPPLF